MMRVLNLILWGILSSTAFGQVNSGAEVLKIGTGSHHSCALFSDGAVKCWGSNSYGELGLGDRIERGEYLTAIDLGEGQRAVDLVVGHNHNCIVLEDRKVKCWGWNQFGQLGLGDRENRGDHASEGVGSLPIVDLGENYRVQQLSAGYGFTCALLEIGALKCWGRNNRGQLGAGDTENRGDEPGEMGDSLLPVNLGTDREIVSLQSGFRHSCVIFSDRSAKCWGGNQYGQLGLGDSLNRGVDPDEMGDALSELDFGDSGSLLKLGVGNIHSCALFDDYTVKCWGSNIFGRIGQAGVLSWGSAQGETPRVLQPIEFGSFSLALDLWVGDHGTCVALLDYSVKCWGSNSDGELGLGDRISRGDDLRLMGDALPAIRVGRGKRIVDIDSGSAHTCAKLSDGSVRCWGSNMYSQLGLDPTLERWGDIPSHMGDALPEVMLTDNE